MSKNKGFTLVELLVSIAIISFLASFAFVNVRDSQLKARDENIKKHLLGVINAAEFLIGEGATTYDAVCDETDNTLSNSGDFGRLESAIKENNRSQTVTCFESLDKKDFAVSSPLLFVQGHWCVDTKGVAKSIQGAITQGQCP